MNEYKINHNLIIEKQKIETVRSSETTTEELLFPKLPRDKVLLTVLGKKVKHDYCNYGKIKVINRENNEVLGEESLDNEELEILKKKYEESSKSFEQALKNSEIVGQMREIHTVRGK